MIISSGMRLTPARLSIPTGRVSMSATNVASTSVAVAFGFTFAAIPRVLPELAGPTSALWLVKAVNVTTTGFTLLMYTATGATASATAVPVDWVAIPV